MPNNLTLIHLLQDQFAADPKLKEKCIGLSKNQIQNGSANRVFDHFPLLIDDVEFASLQSKYINIFVDKCNKHNIYELEKTIVIDALESLLDENGQVNHELITLLEWQEFESTLDNYLIICAFVEVMNSRLITQTTINTEYPDEYQAFLDLVNMRDGKGGYAKLVRDTMHEQHIKYDPKHDIDLEPTDIATYVKNHPGFVLSTFGGLFGVATYFGVKYAMKVVDDHKSLVPHKS